MSRLPELKLFEEEIIQLVKSSCIAKSALLKANGLSIKGPDLRILIDNPDNYRSELEISIWKDTSFIDVFEFFVCSNGKENVKLNEVDTYIKFEIDKILQTLQVQ